MRSGVEKGFVFVSILLTLILIGGIYIFFSMGGSNAPMEKAKQNSSIMACRTSRITAERQVVLWKVTHPGQRPTAEALAAADLALPDCPGGGQLSLDGDKVRCSLHADDSSEVDPLPTD